MAVPACGRPPNCPGYARDRSRRAFATDGPSTAHSDRRCSAGMGSVLPVLSGDAIGIIDDRVARGRQRGSGGSIPRSLLLTRTASRPRAPVPGFTKTPRKGAGQGVGVNDDTRPRKPRQVDRTPHYRGLSRHGVFPISHRLRPLPTGTAVRPALCHGGIVATGARCRFVADPSARTPLFRSCAVPREEARPLPIYPIPHALRPAGHA